MALNDVDKLIRAINGVGSDFCSGLTNEEASVVVRGSKLDEIATHLAGIEHALERIATALEGR